MLKQRIIIHIIVLVFLLCSCSDSSKPATVETSISTEPVIIETEPVTTETIVEQFDPKEIEEILQGTWIYVDTNIGSTEMLQFENGTLTVMYTLDAAPDKATNSTASYTIYDGYISLYFPKTDYTNRFDYSWLGEELVLHKYIDSGADKGNTRVYVKQNTNVPDESIAATKSAASVTDGYDALVGSWVVGGFYYEQNNKQYLIDVSDDDALTDIFDSTYLIFGEGGTFLYMNIYNHSGECICQDDGSFLLNTDKVFTYDITEDGLIEKVVEDAEKTSYIVSSLDENTLLWNILDPSTGKVKSESESLIFKKEDTESEYIQKNKTKLNNSSQEDNTYKQDQPKTNTSDSNNNKKTQNVTSGMHNALKSAKNYLSIMPFSYSGLIKQLEYEGYAYSEAVYAADNCGADWYEQAVKAAENYLTIMAFSRAGLIEQLEYEGYTHDQAVYGADRAY